MQGGGKDMNNRAVVTCNEGFISAQMSYIEAVKFAHLLEERGNYQVKVRLV
jgi:hypothetical protein